MASVRRAPRRHIGIEKTYLPQPFSWIVRACDFISLRAIVAIFFSPCASFVTHYAAVALTTLCPLIVAVLINLAAVPLYFYRADRGWAAWWSAVDRCGMRYFATALLLFYTSICVKAFEHFNCRWLRGN